jgi:hypothetical protein
MSCIFAFVSDYINCLANVIETMTQYTDNTTNVKILHSGATSKIRAEYNPTHTTVLFLTYLSKPRL